VIATDKKLPRIKMCGCDIPELTQLRALCQIALTCRKKRNWKENDDDDGLRKEMKSPIFIPNFDTRIRRVKGG